MAVNPVGALRGTVNDPRFVQYLSDNFDERFRYNYDKAWRCDHIKPEKLAEAINDWNSDSDLGGKLDPDGVNRKIGLGAIDLDQNGKLTDEETKSEPFKEMYQHFCKAYDGFGFEDSLDKEDLDALLYPFTPEQRDYQSGY